MESVSVFTCCFCGKFNYEAGCVLRTAFIFDAILFGGWIFHALGNLGNSNLRGLTWLYIAFAFLYLGVTIYAIMTACSLRTYASQGILMPKIQKYTRLRSLFVIILLVTGILVSLVWYFTVRSYLSEEGSNYTSQEANSIAANISLSVVIPFVIDVVILLGYRESFFDSTTAITRQAFTQNAVHQTSYGVAHPNTSQAMMGAERMNHSHNHMSPPHQGMFHHPPNSQPVYVGAPPRAIG